MTASGLRREAAKGRLVIERTANKDYTTLADIERMRAQCRSLTKDLDSGRSPLTKERTGAGEHPSGSSEMETLSVARASALRTAERLRRKPSKPSPTTSPRSTNPPASTDVTPHPSRSPT